MRQIGQDNKHLYEHETRYPEGLYIHLPFCSTMCTYCDFARDLYGNGHTSAYLEALAHELQARVLGLKRAFQCELFAPKTIYCGGGTPTALSIPEWECVFAALRKSVDFKRVVEFTVEANPGSADLDKLKWLLQQGVNRISFGVQSFQPHLLQMLGRVHAARQGKQSVEVARALGYRNISIDLMHGLPGQSMSDLQDDLEQALVLQTEHISAYGLIYEQGTPLTRAVEQNRFQRLTPEEEAERYRYVLERLYAAGMPAYELGNFARPGMEAQHNLIYWRNEAYLGVGLGAAGYINRVRYTNLREMKSYLARMQELAGMEAFAPDDPLSAGPIAEAERLDDEALAREALVLALRLRTGVAPESFKARWHLDLLGDNPSGSRIEFLLEHGLLEWHAGNLRIPQAKLPIADAILSELV